MELVDLGGSVEFVSGQTQFARQDFDGNAGTVGRVEDGGCVVAFHGEELIIC